MYIVRKKKLKKQTKLEQRRKIKVKESVYDVFNRRIGGFSGRKWLSLGDFCAYLGFLKLNMGGRLNWEGDRRDKIKINCYFP